jgi:hypothetical protein
MMTQKFGTGPSGKTLSAYGLLLKHYDRSISSYSFKGIWKRLAIAILRIIDVAFNDKK